MGFAIAAAVFLTLLVFASLIVTNAKAARSLRMVGPAVERWGGFVLVLVGVWFLVLTALARPPLLT